MRASGFSGCGGGQCGCGYALPADPPGGEAPNRERHARPDEHDAADTADTGDDLTGESEELAGVAESHPAARALAEVLARVRLPLAHGARLAIQRELRSRER